MKEGPTDQPTDRPTNVTHLKLIMKTKLNDVIILVEKVYTYNRA